MESGDGPPGAEFVRDILFFYFYFVESSLFFDLMKQHFRGGFVVRLAGRLKCVD